MPCGTQLYGHQVPSRIKMCQIITKLGPGTNLKDRIFCGTDFWFFFLQGPKLKRVIFAWTSAIFKPSNIIFCHTFRINVWIMILFIMSVLRMTSYIFWKWTQLKLSFLKTSLFFVLLSIFLFPSVVSLSIVRRWKRKTNDVFRI